jgi:hypothetical protein
MDNYEKLFSKSQAPEPPNGLVETILTRIEQREKRILGIKIVASTLMFAASLWVIGIGYVDFATTLTNSGFLQFSSLLFSDFSSIVSNLPDFIFSMVESFPIFSAAAMLTGVGVAIWSMAALLDETSLMGVHKFSYSK